MQRKTANNARQTQVPLHLKLNKIFMLESSLHLTYAEASQSYIMSRKHRRLSLNMQIT